MNLSKREEYLQERERLDQEITSTLQAIDANFSRATQVATSLLAQASQYTNHTRRIHGALSAWYKSFDSFVESPDDDDVSETSTDSKGRTEFNNDTTENKENIENSGHKRQKLNARKNLTINTSLSFSENELSSLRTPTTPSFKTSFAKTPAAHLAAGYLHGCFSTKVKKLESGDVEKIISGEEKLKDTKSGETSMTSDEPVFCSPPISTPFYKPSKTPGLEKVKEKVKGEGSDQQKGETGDQQKGETGDQQSEVLDTNMKDALIDNVDVVNEDTGSSDTGSSSLLATDNTSSTMNVTTGISSAASELSDYETEAFKELARSIKTPLLTLSQKKMARAKPTTGDAKSKVKDDNVNEAFDMGICEWE